VHTPTVTDQDIRRLRDIHIEIDHAVAEAYDWSDLLLDHGFHSTRQGTRFSVSEAARTELLDRLLELNHTLHDKDEELGLTPKRGRRAAREVQQAMRLGS
ncbi:MAG: hypothetical protein J2P44_00005, partial [Candidatus Dormibacteraeota bacterium]|nr:hypothetical protein [Candidatus Dormibacteraeota bacterium]